MSRHQETTIGNCTLCGAPIAVGERDSVCPNCGARYRSRPDMPQSQPILVRDGRARSLGGAAPGWRGVNIAGLTVLLVGLLMAGTGAAVLLASLTGGGEAILRLERARLLSAAGLSDSQPGGEVLLEGRISPRNDPLHGAMVAYQRASYQGSDSDGKDVWQQDERRTPALQIEVADGAVRLAEGAYDLAYYPHTEQSDRLVYRGFQAGDIVLVFGRTEAGSPGPAVRAERMLGGGRAEHLARLRADRAARQIVSGLFIILGLAIALTGGFVIRRY